MITALEADIPRVSPTNPTMDLKAKQGSNPPRSRLEHLQSLAVFGGLTEATLRYLLEESATHRVAPGEYFYRQGEPAGHFYVLERGQVLLSVHDGHREHLLKAFTPGDCFGEVSLIDLGPRSGSAQAVAEASAIAIGSELLYNLYERDVAQFSVLFMNLTREICRRLRDAEARLALTWRTRDQQREEHEDS